jgi:fructokinase
MTAHLKPIYGGIEAGGTKFLCAVGSSPDDIDSLTRFATTTPAQTLARVLEYFRSEIKKHPLAAIGIGSFGPLDLDPSSPTCGHITTTPKPGWSGADIAGIIRRALGLPVFLDTDVNAAALGEGKWGAARGLENYLYITVGTGIGGGGVINGRLVHGLTHPEMGHISLPHDRAADPFAGCCPFHGDCLEGLASGAALQQRWNMSPQAIPDGHPGWKIEAEYLARAAATYICTLSPQIIILGGGIMQKAGLLSLVQAQVLKNLNGYITAPALTDHVETYLVHPALGDLSGIAGALALAQGLAP